MITPACGLGSPPSAGPEEVQRNTLDLRVGPSKEVSREVIRISVISQAFAFKTCPDNGHMPT
jgi:hypothetical protein